MSAFAEQANAAETLEFHDLPLGQRCPIPCPEHCPHPEGTVDDRSSDPLGAPMTIREVARVLGCSTWTIRQRYLPHGLPHLRLSRTGKLMFFHNQIVRWVLRKQREKGGDFR